MRMQPFEELFDAFSSVAMLPRVMLAIGKGTSTFMTLVDECLDSCSSTGVLGRGTLAIGNDGEISAVSVL